jgi:hypothetical protein
LEDVLDGKELECSLSAWFRVLHSFSHQGLQVNTATDNAKFIQHFIIVT